MARIRELAKKTPKFILSNVLGTVVDTAVLWLFSEHVFASYFGEYVVSPVISFECAVFVNFLCSWFFIWKDRVVTGSGKSFFRKYLGCGVLQSCGALHFGHNQFFDGRVGHFP